MTAKTSEAIEITLPSGTFARVRPIRFVDKLAASAGSIAAEAAFNATPGDERAGINMFVPALVARCVLFDDRKLTAAEVLELDSRDTDALLAALLPYIQGPIT